MPDNIRSVQLYLHYKERASLCTCLLRRHFELILLLMDFHTFSFSVADSIGKRLNTSTFNAWSFVTSSCCLLLFIIVHLTSAFCSALKIKLIALYYGLFCKHWYKFYSDTSGGTRVKQFSTNYLITVKYTHCDPSCDFFRHRPFVTQAVVFL